MHLKYKWRLHNFPAEFRVLLTNGSCLACVYRVMDARGKFGEHERSVRVFRGASITRYTHAKTMNQLFYNIAKWNLRRKGPKPWWKTGKKSLTNYAYPRKRMWRYHCAQQDYGWTLALVNPIARISWLCYNFNSWKDVYPKMKFFLVT